jgi:uncharacterized membrane protein YraQ (UPF0718 family)
MIEFFQAFARNTWEMVAEMAPYLIFGFAIAGMLHILIRPERVQRLLGTPGIGAVLKACLIGVPMPLCSCSVIPVAASLRQSGASRGATSAFLSSTPQTGVDSILATYALMGGLFTAVRVAVAFVCGIVTGFLVELCCNGKSKDASPKTSDSSPLTFSPTNQAALRSTAPLNSISLSPKTAPKADCCATTLQPRGWSEALRYGFIQLPADLALALLFGLTLAGLITTLLPPDLISGSFSSGPLAFFLATVISLPLYVCATASIPMAYALMAAGLSPGAVLIFLITGPATNTATIVTVWKMLGRKATLIYLGSLLVVSWLSGWLFNASLDQQPMVTTAHQHEVHAPALWQHTSGFLLILILLCSLYITRKPKKADSGGCCG